MATDDAASHGDCQSGRQTSRPAIKRQRFEDCTELRENNHTPGVRLTGELPEGATATDPVLHVTGLLRDVGVIDRFVEFCGPAVETLTVPDRATIANNPEYTEEIEPGLGDIEPRLVGTSEPNQLISMGYMKTHFRELVKDDINYGDIDR